MRHPEYEDFLEEDWFYEAMTETYIPLLNIFERLAEENIESYCVISISPTLAAMMSDTLLISRYERKLAKLIELAEKEVWRTRYQPEFHETAKMYERKFKEVRQTFEKYNRNILNGYKRLQDEDKIEIITCAATHAFLPLALYEDIIRAQIKCAVDDYIEKFGRKPNGIWLPECAYQPELDGILKEAGIKYFFLETHGVLYGTPRPKYANFAPIYCPSGVAAFGRDMETAHQVWSADVGYPGDFDYREFYRDVGYDLDYDYIRPYLHSDGVRRNIGIKYYRITGRVPLSHKEPYNPQWALNKAAIHAGNFMFNREHQINFLHDFFNGKRVIIVSPYDTELFGHWWFEGPDFLNFLYRKIQYDQKVFKPITPTKYLDLYPQCQIVQPATSSWGDKGYFEVWLNGTNDWIYRHLHRACERMIEVAKKYGDVEGIKERAINQMFRELFLALASDWAFIMTTRTMVEYAVKRTKEHILNFIKLYEDVNRDSVDENFLNWLEFKNNIFPTISYKELIRA